MKIIKEKKELIDWRSENLDSPSLVPTMGNLHDGHLSLVGKALEVAQTCVVSIFVNPLQFAEGEDYEKYPKTFESDIAKLQKIEDASGKSIVVYAPQDPKQIYPNENKTFIEVKGLDDFLCGKFRPGHFTGVTTVVYHLFNLIRPKISFFGQKDYQQLCIISKMTRDLGLPVEIGMGETIRSDKGLALSSRNQYLSDSHKSDALTLSKTLKQAVEVYRKSGLAAAQEFIENVKEEDRRFQYLKILDALSLKSPSSESKKLVVAGAFILGDTRLIDNFLI